MPLRAPARVAGIRRHQRTGHRAPQDRPRCPPGHHPGQLSRAPHGSLGCPLRLPVAIADSMGTAMPAIAIAEFGKAEWPRRLLPNAARPAISKRLLIIPPGLAFANSVKRPQHSGESRAPKRPPLPRPAVHTLCTRRKPASQPRRRRPARAAAYRFTPPTWPTKRALRINCDAAWPAPGPSPTPPHTPARTTSPAPPNRTSPAPSRTRSTPQAEPGLPPKQNQAHPQQNQAHPSRQDRPTPDRTRPAPDRTRPAPQNRTSPALRQNQSCAPAEPGPRPQTRRHAGGSGGRPEGNSASHREARHRRAKIRATPGGYGGKPPGVAIIGVPTGARKRRQRRSDGGPEHRYECYTETPPSVSRPNCHQIAAGGLNRGISWRCRGPAPRAGGRFPSAARPGRAGPAG